MRALEASANDVAVRGRPNSKVRRALLLAVLAVAGSFGLASPAPAGALPTPILCIDDEAVREGHDAAFTVRLEPAQATPVEVDWYTANGTAVFHDDFSLRSETLTFPAGDTRETITVPVFEDQVDEGTETFRVVLTDPTPGVVIPTGGCGEGEATIFDDDVRSILAVDDIEIREGDDGTRAASFTVKLFPGADESVTVEYFTGNGTAVAPDDYENRAGLLTFDPGERSETVTVAVRGDEDQEGDETFSLNLANETNAVVADRTGLATIVDDDVTPSVTIDDIEITEGDDGTKDAVFTVTLFPKADERVTVEFTTENVDAISPDDYLNTSGLLTFDPGETTKRIRVPVVGDAVDEAGSGLGGSTVTFDPNRGFVGADREAGQVFNVRLLNPTHARLADSLGRAVIIDNDLTPSLSVGDVTVTEGDDGVVPGVVFCPVSKELSFPVFLFPASGERVTVEFSTRGDTADALVDYLPAAGVLTFAPGEQLEKIVVPVCADRLDEPNEVISVALVNPVNAELLDAGGIATLIDDDLPPSLLIADASVLESDPSGRGAAVTVRLTQPSGLDVTFRFTTRDDTATSPSDYLATSGPVTIPAGETAVVLTIPIRPDRLEERDETFFVDLVNPPTGGGAGGGGSAPGGAGGGATATNATVADAEALVVIVDDDAPAAARLGMAPTKTAKGYWIAAQDGSVYAFGDATHYGPEGRLAPNRPIVGLAATPNGRGYWLVASDGGIFSFGDARFLGSTGALTLNSPIVGMAATPNGRGYWLVASDGGIFSFGDADFFGSTGGMPLNRAIVGMAASPTGHGYWLVASDGGIFAFGDAEFFGSTGSLALNQPIVGMSATPNGRGYWLVASDGGIFSFGDARFLGSTGGLRLNRPIVGLARTPSAKGYWLVATDGGIFSFGDAEFLGSTGGIRLADPPPAGPAVPGRAA